MTIGQAFLLPQPGYPYFFWAPIPLAPRSAETHGKLAQNDGDDDAKRSRARRSARGPSRGVTFANGGDNIGVYGNPSSSAWNPSQWSPTASVFLALVAVLVVVAKFVAARPPIAEVLERWEHILFPIVLIGLGIVILVSGGAFGL